MVVLNTIVANQLKQFKSEVDAILKSKKGMKVEDAIKGILRGYIADSRKILFGGNGYGEEWKKEAKKRGLSNITTTPEAFIVIGSISGVVIFANSYNDIFLSPTT